MYKYTGSFTCREDVAAEFEQGTGQRWNREAVPYVPAADFPTEEQIIYADYDQEAYSGTAFVLFEQDGKLFEVHGSHCSCFGLEDQWTPEETSWQAIAMRPVGWQCPQAMHDLAVRKVSE